VFLPGAPSTPISRVGVEATSRAARSLHAEGRWRQERAIARARRFPTPSCVRFVRLPAWQPRLLSVSIGLAMLRGLRRHADAKHGSATPPTRGPTGSCPSLGPPGATRVSSLEHTSLPTPTRTSRSRPRHRGRERPLLRCAPAIAPVVVTHRSSTPLRLAAYCPGSLSVVVHRRRPASSHRSDRGPTNFRRTAASAARGRWFPKGAVRLLGRSCCRRSHPRVPSLRRGVWPSLPLQRACRLLRSPLLRGCKAEFLAATTASKTTGPASLSTNVTSRPLNVLLVWYPRGPQTSRWSTTFPAGVPPALSGGVQIVEATCRRHQVR